MRLVVTNDDGVGTPGLDALTRALADAGHEVTVVAPSSERSGSATSLGVIAEAALVPVFSDGPEVDGAARTIAVDAPPAMAVRAACLGCFGPPPQLVVAGINPGLNTGRMVLHSGTVGGAWTALTHDISGIALSTARGAVHGTATAATIGALLVEAVAGAGSPIAVNVNVPDRAPGTLAGVAEASLGPESLIEIDLSLEPDGLRVRRVLHGPPFQAGTDADLLTRGYVAVSGISGPWAGATDVGPVLARLERDAVTAGLWRSH